MLFFFSSRNTLTLSDSLCTGSGNQNGFNPKQGLKECGNGNLSNPFPSGLLRKGRWEVNLCSGRKAAQLKFKVLQGKFFHPA